MHEDLDSRRHQRQQGKFFADQTFWDLASMGIQWRIELWR
jgi:hypothetical protein